MNEISTSSTWPTLSPVTPQSSDAEAAKNFCSLLGLSNSIAIFSNHRPAYRCHFA